jgi:pimeloyl-ACP methyl ester carboxylesterase
MAAWRRSCSWALRDGLGVCRSRLKILIPRACLLKQPGAAGVNDREIVARRSHAGTYDFDGMSINQVVIGEGRPVVMLHGWTIDHQVMLRCMEPVFEKRNGWKRIYVDLPGMGRSEADPSIRNSDDMCAAVLRFLDARVEDEQFAVCGYSYGALIARGIAHFRRELVCGLMLMAPLVVAENAQRVLPEFRVFRNDPALLARMSSDEAADFETTLVLQTESVWERYRKEVWLPSRAASAAFLDPIRQHAYGFTFDVDTASPPFDFPALIVTGRQDNAVGFKDAWRLIDKFPRATFAALDMAGHVLQIEQPRIFEALVNDWLDRLEMGASSFGSGTHESGS